MRGEVDNNLFPIQPNIVKILVFPIEKSPDQFVFDLFFFQNFTFL